MYTVTDVDGDPPVKSPLSHLATSLCFLLCLIKSSTYVLPRRLDPGISIFSDAIIMGGGLWWCTVEVDGVRRLPQYEVLYTRGSDFPVPDDSIIQQRKKERQISVSWKIGSLDCLDLIARECLGWSAHNGVLFQKRRVNVSSVCRWIKSQMEMRTPFKTFKVLDETSFSISLFFKGLFAKALFLKVSFHKRTADVLCTSHTALYFNRYIGSSFLEKGPIEVISLGLIGVPSLIGLPVI